MFQWETISGWTVELLNGVPGERDGGLKGERLRLVGSKVWWKMEGNGE